MEQSGVGHGVGRQCAKCEMVCPVPPVSSCTAGAGGAMQGGLTHSLVAREGRIASMPPARFRFASVHALCCDPRASSSTRARHARSAHWPVARIRGEKACKYVPSVDASANHREGFLWLPLDECNAVCTSKQLHTIFREQPPTRLEHVELEGWKTNRTETGLQHHGEDRNDKDESRRASAASRIASAVRAISTRTCGQSGIHSSSTSVWHSESVMAGNLSVP